MDVQKGILSCDIETKSVADLIRIGAWAYASDESTDVYCVVFGYAESADGPYVYTVWEPGDALPQDVVDFILAGGTVLAHNASFEVAIWRLILEPKYGFPPLELDQVADTQVLGVSMNLPMSLEGLAKVLGCSVQKDKEGKALMLKMCKLVEVGPGKWANAHDTPANRARLVIYCRDDVGATLDCFYRLKPLDVTEALVYLVDKRINARGVFLDRGFAEDCMSVVMARKAELDGEVLTGLTDWRAIHIKDSRNPAALKVFLKEHGVEIPTRTRKKKEGGRMVYKKSESTDKSAVAEMLARTGLHEDVRVVLTNRLESTKATSLSKLGRVDSMVGFDGRLRFALRYCFAHTGRWTSSGLQVHNLPKDKLEELGGVVRAALRERDLEAIKFLADRPLEAISSCLRSILRAAPGKELIAADFSAVEAVVVAWLSGQEDVLAVMRSGQDIYVKAAHDVGSTKRALGKVCTLALGYGMGVLTFVTTAANWGVPLELKEAHRIQKAWRRANDCIVGFWKDIEEAAKGAVTHPGTAFYAGRIKAIASEGVLGLVLPSGRVLYYWKPSIVMAESVIKIVDAEGVIEEKTIMREELRFYTVGKDKGSMVLESTYGGKLAENVTQAVARDLLAEATVRIDRVAPYEIVMHVHDSIAAEVPKGAGDVDDFCRLMAELPKWAKGMPLTAEGYRSTRFEG